MDRIDCARTFVAMLQTLPSLPPRNATAIEPGQCGESTAGIQKTQIAETRRGESVRPMPHRQHAPRGKQHADQEFLAGKGARPQEREIPRCAARVHAGKISESRGSQYRITLARNGRHEGKDDSRSGAGCGNGHGQKRAPVTPMKPVALAQGVLRRACAGRQERQAGDRPHTLPRWQAPAAAEPTAADARAPPTQKPATRQWPPWAHRDWPDAKRQAVAERRRCGVRSRRGPECSRAPIMKRREAALLLILGDESPQPQFNSAIFRTIPSAICRILGRGDFSRSRWPLASASCPCRRGSTDSMRFR